MYNRKIITIKGDKWVPFCCKGVVEYVMDIFKLKYEDKSLDTKNDSGWRRYVSLTYFMIILLF